MRVEFRQTLDCALSDGTVISGGCGNSPDCTHSGLITREPVGLVLSRRNLEALLAKLDGHPPGSALTLGAPSQYGEFYVRAEEDESHYAHASREEAVGVRGPLHPDTERALGG